jgi:hypothetical protein
LYSCNNMAHRPLLQSLIQFRKLIAQSLYNLTALSIDAYHPFTDTAFLTVGENKKCKFPIRA